MLYLYYIYITHNSKLSQSDTQQGLTVFWDDRMYILQYILVINTANTSHSLNAVLMLGQRRRRWLNFETPLRKLVNVSCLLGSYLIVLSKGTDVPDNNIGIMWVRGVNTLF